MVKNILLTKGLQILYQIDISFMIQMYIIVTLDKLTPNHYYYYLNMRPTYIFIGCIF